MQRVMKMLGAALVAASLGLFMNGQTPVMANAAVKAHKVTKLPKTFWGTWYSKGHKIKVIAKKFAGSTYRRKHDTNSIASSERYFMPYRLRTPKNTMYLVTSGGINTIRCAKIGGQTVLIRYDEQNHENELTIYTKAKKSRYVKGHSPIKGSTSG